MIKENTMNQKLYSSIVRAYKSISLEFSNERLETYNNLYFMI